MIKVVFVTRRRLELILDNDAGGIPGPRNFWGKWFDWCMDYGLIEDQLGGVEVIHD